MKPLALAVGLSLLVAYDGSAAVRIAAIGDQGVDDDATRALGRTLARLQSSPETRFDGVVFLGDNFYPRGLNGRRWESLRDAVLGHFRSPGGGHAILGLPRAAVHAVAGNHDYYRDLWLGRLPLGFTSVGNARAAAVDDWTYHHWWPSEGFYWAAPGIRVQFMFFDSARVAGQADHAGPEYEELTRRLKDYPLDPADRSAIRWRVIAMHHPLYSVGSHGNQGEDCDRLPFSHRAWGALGGGSQDLCMPGYRTYVADLKRAIEESGVRVQLALAGHDHSLQLLERDPGAAGAPWIHVVSGAAHEGTAVAATSAAKSQYTSRGTGGKSRLGFAELLFQDDALRIRFLGSETGRPLDLANGEDGHAASDGLCEFWIGLDGRLAPPRAGAGCPGTEARD